SSRRRHTRSTRDWSSDVCSSDLDRLIDLMDYQDLRREQSELRKKNIYRGIGLALFVEGTGAGSLTFGPAGVRIGSRDGVTVRLRSEERRVGEEGGPRGRRGEGMR